MNSVLSFLVEPLNHHGPEVLTVTPLIDGIVLTELIERYEHEHGMEPAGGYGGLVPAFFRYGSFDRYFLGKSEGEYFNEERSSYLLACQCGEVGCWPLSARISTTETEVIWHGFAQKYQPKRDYSGFGPFVFEIAAYTKTVGEIASRFRQYDDLP